jgi:hypothetical protein
MKTLFKILAKATSVAVCLTSFSLLGQATTVILWDGSSSYSSANLVNVGSTGTQSIAAGEDFSQSLAYSTSVAKFDPGVTPTYLSTAQSVYGGHYLHWNNNTASSVDISTVALQYQNTSPRTFFSTSGSNSTIQRTSNFALMFGLNTPGNYTFDATSVLSATIRQTVNAGTREGKWIVVANGTTYLSQTSITLTGTGDNSLTLTNPHTANWAEWNPGADMSFGSLTYNIAGSSFSNITLAGFAENSFLDSGNGTRNVAVKGFSADLVLIPEPSSFVLLMGSLSVLLLLQRRHKGNFSRK